MNLQQHDNRTARTPSASETAAEIPPAAERSSGIGDEAVPLLSREQRELDRDREERLRVLTPRRRRRLAPRLPRGSIAARVPEPPRSAILVGAVVVLGAAAAIAAAAGGVSSSSTAPPRTAADTSTVGPHAATETTRPDHSAVAQARRRAALRARAEAARRRARSHARHRQQHRREQRKVRELRARKARQAEAARAADESENTTITAPAGEVESSPPPESTPPPETAPPPEPAPVETAPPPERDPTQTSAGEAPEVDPVEKEFSFEQQR